MRIFKIAGAITLAMAASGAIGAGAATASSKPDANCSATFKTDFDPQPVSTVVSPKVRQRLTCEEQVQSASTVYRALKYGIGGTAVWESATRPGVKGSITVYDQKMLPSGARCMLIEDTTYTYDEGEVVVKESLCSPPGGGVYVLTD